jgi:hypothetical protein
MVYREIKDGRLRVMKVGNRTLISRRAARDYERLCEQPRSDPPTRSLHTRLIDPRKRG